MEAARRLPAPARYGLALLGVAVVTALIAALGRFHLANASMLYLIVVLLAAVALGRGPAVMVAFVAFLASNFFLVEPRFSLTVANPEEWVTLILLLLTAVVTGQVAAGQEQRAEEAEANAREARLLTEVAQLMTEPNLDPALGRVAERLRGELGVLAVRIVVNGEDGGLLASASAGAGTDLEALSAALAGGGSEVLSPSGGRWVRVVQPHAGRAGRHRCIGPALRLLRVPVRAPHGETGEVILAARRDSHFGPAEVRLLESVSAQLWGAVDRARLRDEANEAEVLRRADQVKSALLDAVSHDLRTPLASILASAGSLRQRDVEWDEEARRSFAEAIEQEAHRLDRIVGNLLDLSRLESGTLQPDRGWYEPTALINEVAARLRPLVAPHALALDLPDELPPVHLDYSEVDQVLSNLIENAAKYSPPESEIRVSAAVADGSLRVDVDRPRAWGGARRVAAPVRAVLPRRPRPAWGQRPGPGGGPRPGGGARRPHLGREPAGGRRPLQLRDPRRHGGAMSEAGGRGARILVVDDEPALRRAVERNLAGHGFEVRGAETGEEGLELETRFHPDLVLLDLGLPDIAGTEVITRLRERSSLPIIVLSVREAEGDKVRALELGADDYLTKPFGVDELLARIRVALRHAARSGVRDRFRLPQRRPVGRPRTPRGADGRAARAPHADRVRAAGRPDRRCRPRADRPCPAAAGLGPRVRVGGPLPARLHGPPAQEAGARSGQSPLPAHRAGRRLPPARAGDRSSQRLEERATGLRQC